MTRAHPCYQGRHSLRPSNLATIKRFLALGPWFWPPESESEAFATAATVIADGPPQIQPGQFPLVAYASQTGSIWKLDPYLQHSDQGVSEFLIDAQTCWQTAVSAVPRSVPVLWKGLTPLRSRPLLASFCIGGGKAAALGDRSFGLAFALAIISEIAGIPAPSDITASATIDEFGNPGPVGGLAQKIDAITDYAPGIRRFFVHKGQLDEATEAARDRLEIVGVTSLAEAISTVFPELLSALIDRAQSPQDRSLHIEEMFQLAIGRRDSMVEWKALKHAAESAGRAWQDLPDEQNRMLDFVIAISDRHDGNQGALEIPPLSWLQKFTQPFRTEILAHLVQQSTDTGNPEPKEILEFAEPHLIRGPDAFPVHLKLLGSLGRLLYVLGDHQEALDHQIEAIEAWLARRRYDEVSYPLSFAFDVAGALGDQTAFQHLEDLEHQWQTLGAITKTNYAYIACSKARALWLFQRHEESEALLREALAIPDMSTSFRQTICRRLTQVLEHEGRHTEVETLALDHPNIELSWLTSHPSAETLKETEEQWLLLELSRKVHFGDHNEALHLVERLLAKKPQSITNMLRYARVSDEHKPAFLVRYYTY